MSSRSIGSLMRPASSLPTLLGADAPRPCPVRKAHRAQKFTTHLRYCARGGAVNSWHEDRALPLQRLSRSAAQPWYAPVRNPDSLSRSSIRCSPSMRRGRPTSTWPRAHILAKSLSASSEQVPGGPGIGGGGTGLSRISGGASRRPRLSATVPPIASKTAWGWSPTRLRSANCRSG